MKRWVRDHPLFSAFMQEYREYARGGGKSSCTVSKMLVLATVPVHLAKQHCIVRFWGGGRGDVKRVLSVHL